MSKTPPNTIVSTGAEHGDVLVGFHRNGNRGLLVQVLESQPSGKTGRLRGEFLVLHEGTGKYSTGIRKVIDRGRYFESADEFIRQVSMEPGCRDCTHSLNLNALWKLDVSLIYDRVIKVEPGPTRGDALDGTEIRRCNSCGKIYDDLSLNFCLDDGTPLTSEPAEVETLVLRSKGGTGDPWKEPRRGRSGGSASYPEYEYIRTAVESHPNLDLVVHRGFNHRISRRGYVGSIWIIPRGKGVSITANGQAANELYREMERLLGRHHREDAKGYRYFQADDPGDVARIIAKWSEI